MKVEKIALEETNSFSSFFLDYLSGKKELKSFYGLEPTPENFKQQIQQKEFSQEKRDTLRRVISTQYEGLEIKDLVANNIASLSDHNTFTITTGHQLNIFTGPLYFIYKIVSVINACTTLKEKYPGNNFVPVYWMASEDHDFEEINHFHLFGKKYIWNCDQKGGVGRFDTSTISDLLSELPEQSDVFSKAYVEHGKLSDAVRCYINELFGQQGVVALDADDPQLKAQFASVIEDDLMNHHANDLVEDTSSVLNKLGYSSQIFPRAINFFYLDGDTRERIVRESSDWKVLSTDLKFSEEEIKELIQSSPEKFSPNVVMRPLYQETILPNLAYIGGPAEMVYWMQLKKVFEQYNTPFPILMPRNFGLVVNKASAKRADKLGFSMLDLFKDEKSLSTQYVEKNSQTQFDLTEEKKSVQVVLDQVEKKALEIDGSLKGFVGAEWSKVEKSLDNIERRLTKANEKKHEVALAQISALKEKLFPGGSPQERHDNFLNFYLNDPAFIDKLVEVFDPFDFRFYVLKGE